MFCIPVRRREVPVLSRGDRPDLLRAYRAAWRDREATGDASDVVLVRRLHLEGITTLPDSAVEMVLDAWRRGVPPRRLVWELSRRGLGPMVSAYRELFRAFR
jgi:hypothetical protein